MDSVVLKMMPKKTDVKVKVEIKEDLKTDEKIGEIQLKVDESSNGEQDEAKDEQQQIYDKLEKLTKHMRQKEYEEMKE